MNGYTFTLANASLIALASGALFWPAQRLLVVSDLHFGKSERLARRGGTLLPPYETRATLARLNGDIEASAAKQVICLGDSFDDIQASGALDASDRLWLASLMAGCEWIWILGNHDAGPHDLGGSLRNSVFLEPLTFCHIAGGPLPEVSGHYHPKASLAGRSHRCFLIDRQRVIMPAYGEYTGGLRCNDPLFDGLMQPGALAILTGRQTHAIPMRSTAGR